MSAACLACLAGGEQEVSQEKASQEKAAQEKVDQERASQANASDAGASHGGAGPRTRQLLARFLGLAATPVFAVMALLAGLPGDGAMDPMCAAMGHGSMLAGMAPMYLVMSVFHCGPWLTLASGPRVSA